MQLKFFRGARPNFGDELNLWMWPRLLPEFLDDDPSVIFIGIGSVLGLPYDTAARKVVVGTGYVPQYHSIVPNLKGPDWDVAFVRGPRTAHALGLDPKIALGDAAILMNSFRLHERRNPHLVGFIPHFESMERGNWSRVCDLAGITLIDPRNPVEHVMAQILDCKVIVCEAMHGAIVADAFRVPWVPVLPIDGVHRYKWFDWADAIDVDLRQNRLWPSSMAELQKTSANWPLIARLAASLDQQKKLFRNAELIEYFAAKRLSAISKISPNLSADSTISRIVDSMLVKLKALRRVYSKQ